MILKNKTVLITGASEGIGEQVAYEFAKQNTNLILISRNKEKLDKVTQKALDLGAKEVTNYSVDLKVQDHIVKFAEEITKNYKSIDGLVNNAGIWQKKAPLDEIPDDEVSAVLNTNLTGLIFLTKKLLPILKQSSEAFIINVSSRSGYSAQEGQSVYTATKYGVKGFTEVLREDLKNSNIRVAGVYQGGTNTQMFNKAGEDFSAEKLASFIPADELAKTIVYMASRPNGIWIPEIKVENK